MHTMTNIGAMATQQPMVQMSGSRPGFVPPSSHPNQNPMMNMPGLRPGMPMVPQVPGSTDIMATQNQPGFPASQISQGNIMPVSSVFLYNTFECKLHYSKTVFKGHCDQGTFTQNGVLTASC